MILSSYYDDDSSDVGWHFDREQQCREMLVHLDIIQCLYPSWRAIFERLNVKSPPIPSLVASNLSHGTLTLVSNIVRIALV